MEAECGADPTAKWGAKRNDHEGPFAVCFAGGLRNFLVVWHSWEKNLVETSGGMVDLYFHVWSDENSDASSAMAVEGRKLAQSLPQTRAYVAESFADWELLVNRDEPAFPAEREKTCQNKSWISYQDVDENGNPTFAVGATFSMWRKAHLAVELVRQSGREYSLVLRARPDHLFIRPLDLRAFGREHASRASSMRARGHFLSIPERSPQVGTHNGLGLC